MDKDITLRCGSGIVNMRVGAIITKGGKFLMVGNERSNYYYSVGGRIKFGETAEEAVRREVFEETGVKLEVDRLGFVHENYFYGDSPKNLGRLIYELSFFFYMKVPDDFEPHCMSFDEDESREHLSWISPDTDRLIYPTFFKTELLSPCGGVRHITTDERQGNGEMRLLFAIDLKNYDKSGTKFIRPSARAIIVRGGKLAMIHSTKYDYYKFPGGGIEKGEKKADALRREVLEEAGLTLIEGSVKEYGYVHRIQKGAIEDVFIQDNYYYLCSVEDGQQSQKLDAYENEHGFTLEFVTAQEAIFANRNSDHGDTDAIMIEREALVLEMLLDEGVI